MDTKIKVAVYRARDANVAYDELIATDGLSTPLQTHIDDLPCYLWITEHDGARPLWIDTFAAIFRVDAEQLLPRPPRSVSGVAFIGGRYGGFAITFGHGWQRIHRDAVDANFGVRCVLNLCQDNSLRAIQRDRMTSELIQVMEQSPEDTGIYRFGIDTEADMLRGVKATIDPLANFGSTASGTDSFRCTWDSSTMSLDKLLQALVALARSTQYRKRFEWIDHICPVRDKNEISGLDAAAVNDVNKAQSKFRLIPPQFSQWDDFDYFIFGRRRNPPVKDELTLSSWLHHLRGMAKNKSLPVTLSVLHDHFVHAIDETNTGRSTKWKVYDCLYGIVSTSSGTFMLHQSHWYKLADDYLNRVQRSLNDVADLSGPMKLPPSKPNEHEDQYNRRAARSSNRRIQLFDRKIIHHGGARSKFEFCDLLSDEMDIYCVKRWANSSGISHLARQAVNTCKLLRSDADFVRKVELRLRGVRRANFLRVKSRDQACRVVFVIMGCSSINDLPFFSRMTLADAVRDIRTLGFGVAFDWV